MSGVPGELAAARQVLWVPRGQHSAAARCERVPEEEDRLPAEARRWLSVSEGLLIRIGIQSIPLYSVYKAFF